jgi:Flp pilus assembly pilin Flp
MKSNRGQAVVEYVLMLVVVAAMITSAMALIKRKFMGDATKCDQAVNKKKFNCKLNAIFSSDFGGPEKRMQYYPFKK